MVTARADERDRILGLDLGADDYVTKPFSPGELMARVRAVLRRAGISEASDVLRIGALEVDRTRFEVRLDGDVVSCTSKEFAVLEALAAEPGRVYTRFQLLERAFGFDYEGLDRTVDVHIMNLRRKIEADPSNPTYIRTVYGVGYKMADDVA